VLVLVKNGKDLAIIKASRLDIRSQQQELEYVNNDCQDVPWHLALDCGTVLKNTENVLNDGRMAWYEG
jgi:hypothetical protein